MYASGSPNCGTGEGGTHHTEQVDTCSERAAVLQVIQKREKDCVSKAAVTAGSVNPKYFYGDETQVWAGSLSGGVAGGVGVIMLDVIQDCYTDLKASDQTEYLRKTNQAFLE